LRLKILSTNLIILLTKLFCPLLVKHVSLKGKLLHATKENTELQQEVAYLTARLEKTVLSEKMIEEDLSRVEESATKSTYKLSVGFERCEDKGEKSAYKFIPSSTYHKRGSNNQIHQSSLPIQSKVVLQSKERSKERNPRAERGSFYLHVLWS
jgi:predicted nuclease with TOPRIM domain